MDEASIGMRLLLGSDPFMRVVLGGEVRIARG